MKKRISALVCAAAALCLIFCGCGKDKTEGETLYIPEEPAEIYAPTPEPAKTIYPKPVTEDYAAMAQDGLSRTAFNGLWTVTLPDSWQGRWGCKEGDYSCRFVDTANAQAGYGGVLFTLLYFSGGQSYDYLPDCLVLYEGDSGVFVASFPTDVQYNWENEALSAEYQSMADGLREWLPAHFSVQ